MATWSKTFTQIDNVNGGQEFGVNDYPTTQGFNVPINNTQYLYNLLQAGFIKSYTISNGTVTIVSRGVNGQDTTTTMTIDTLNGYTKDEINNNFVKYTAQSLTDSQKAQARANINALPQRIELSGEEHTGFFHNGSSLSFYRGDSNHNIGVTLNSDNDITILQEVDNEVIEEFNLIERLNALGFKSGTFTLDTSASLSAYTNTIRKQGKHAIGSISIVGSVSANTDLIIRVPNEFKPKVNTTILMGEYYANLGFFLATTVTLTTNGEISFHWSSSNNNVRLVIENAGWELA